MYKYCYWQICENGILKFRPRSKVAPGYPKAGRGDILFCLPFSVIVGSMVQRCNKQLDDAGLKFNQNMSMSVHQNDDTHKDDA